MSYDLKTDDEIAFDLAQKYDLLRRTKELKDAEVAGRGGTNTVVLNKFRQGSGGVSLKTFIRLIRGIGELDRLEALLAMPERYSPIGSQRSIPAKRVRGRKAPGGGFAWGDES
jgi:hypothetical protein